jgi:8-oxo-dGTP diphosphatase
MWQLIAGKIWRGMPRGWRVFISRIPQTKFTVSAGAVIFNESGQVLLLNHVLRPSSGWGVPGGFIEAREQPEVALKREIREETGLEIHNIKLISLRTIDRHLEIMFRAEASGTPQVLSFEIIEARWFDLKDVPPEMSHSQILLVELAAFDGEKTVK